MSNVPEIPKWARPIRYEYDLGMSTECHQCGGQLIEGQIVLEDMEDTPAKLRALYPEGTEVSARTTYYCSIHCARKAEAAS